MLRNNCYTLKEISGVKYLCPFGQMIADRKRGIRLNDTGAFIWEALKDDLSAEELAELCAEHFDVCGTEAEHIREDVKRYLSELYSMGIIKASSTPPSPSGDYGSMLCIAGLKIRLFGPPEAFSGQFRAFACGNDAPDGPVSQTVIVQPCPPLIRENGTVIIRSPELEIMELADKYIFLFPRSASVTEASLSKDAKTFLLCCSTPYTDELREELFHAIRLGFLYLAHQHGMAVIHSASVLYRDRAWLFSGPSGRGKSTHAELWRRLFGTPLINGDLNLIAIKNDVPMIYGIPWCGTSGICDPSDYRLGGIILLRRAAEDRIEELPEDQKRLLISQRFISPSWNGEMLSENLRIADAAADKILICRLRCTKERTAADTMKAGIDAYLSGN